MELVTEGRKLVTVRSIAAINPIEKADAIEVATVDGWDVVVKKKLIYRTKAWNGYYYQIPDSVAID